MALTTVWSTVNLIGFHRWPEAPDHRAYLRDKHRHQFEVTAWVVVDHAARQVEFHDLRTLITSWWLRTPDDRGASSCEAMADDLAAFLSEQCHLTVAEVQVSEDGYDGARIDYTMEVQA